MDATAHRSVPQGQLGTPPIPKIASYYIIAI